MKKPKAKVSGRVCLFASSSAAAGSDDASVASADAKAPNGQASVVPDAITSPNLASYERNDAPAASTDAKTTDGTAFAVAVAVAAGTPEKPVVTDDEYILDSFGRLGIHEEILKDEVRTMTYRTAIYLNKPLFKGKVVLDVGCGTGILSMYAAKAGAARVIAIECTGIVEYARKIVASNRLPDVITIIEGKVEEVELPVPKVDIIISDWMGNCIFHEGNLESIIYARDKWLQPDGIMFPDRCSLFIAAIEERLHKDAKINWWTDVYGFDMSVMRKVALAEPLVYRVDPKQIMSTPYMLQEMDMYTVTTDDLDVETVFQLIIKRDDFWHALVTYFKADFTMCDRRVRISTSPFATSTRCKQTVFFMDDYVPAKMNELVLGKFRMKRNGRNKRDLDISIDVDYSGELLQLKESNSYRLKRLAL